MMLYRQTMENYRKQGTVLLLGLGAAVLLDCFSTFVDANPMRGCLQQKCKKELGIFQRSCDTYFDCKFQPNPEQEATAWFKCDGKNCACELFGIMREEFGQMAVGWETKTKRCSVGLGGACGRDNGIEIFCDNGYECVNSKCEKVANLDREHGCTNKQGCEFGQDPPPCHNPNGCEFGKIPLATTVDYGAMETDSGQKETDPEPKVPHSDDIPPEENEVPAGRQPPCEFTNSCETKDTEPVAEPEPAGEHRFYRYGKGDPPGVTDDIPNTNQRWDEPTNRQSNFETNKGYGRSLPENDSPFVSKHHGGGGERRFNRKAYSNSDVEFHPRAHYGSTYGTRNDKSRAYDDSRGSQNYSSRDRSYDRNSRTDTEQNRGNNADRGRTYSFGRPKDSSEDYDRSRDGRGLRSDNHNNRDSRDSRRGSSSSNEFKRDSGNTRESREYKRDRSNTRESREFKREQNNRDRETREFRRERDNNRGSERDRGRNNRYNNDGDRYHGYGNSNRGGYNNNYNSRKESRNTAEDFGESPGITFTYSASRRSVSSGSERGGESCGKGGCGGNKSSSRPSSCDGCGGGSNTPKRPGSSCGSKGCGGSSRPDSGKGSCGGKECTTPRPHWSNPKPSMSTGGCEDGCGNKGSGSGGSGWDNGNEDSGCGDGGCNRPSSRPRGNKGCGNSGNCSGKGGGGSHSFRPKTTARPRLPCGPENGCEEPKEEGPCGNDSSGGCNSSKPAGRPTSGCGNGGCHSKPEETTPKPEDPPCKQTNSCEEVEDNSSNPDGNCDKCGSYNFYRYSHNPS